ncbi:hypothetical protein MWU57_01250 [Isoptericola sp. S6320L]|uniref:hypothetical protein n=1 Tax=Isoptericola sp. S6320L TaxID=2926411 RepID=UPI001FF1647F|nr:hypothetical protein [Isoptericola sp. S6320L]MCK0115645.1 hypothetical protein [Isoptericola sp. S6320L]
MRRWIVRAVAVAGAFGLVSFGAGAAAAAVTLPEYGRAVVADEDREVTLADLVRLDAFDAPAVGGSGGLADGEVPGEIIDLAAAARVIGVSRAQLDVALAREGATLAGVAARHGVASENLVDALVADAARRLDQAVLAGGVTVVEVAERRSALADVVRDAVEADRSVGPV